MQNSIEFDESKKVDFLSPFAIAVLILLAAAILIGPIHALSATSGPSKINSFKHNDPEQIMSESPINADMVCGDQGGAIHINNAEEKVWQAEIDSTEGILLNVTEFQRLRCPRCFNILAELEIMGDVIYYTFETRLKSMSKGGPKNTMKVTLARDSARKKVVDSWTWNCK